MPRLLPPRPDLGQLRHQAKELLRAARSGDRRSLERIRTVSDRLVLASAQLALAREFGFPSWARLRAEVDRRRILNDRDVARLRHMLEVQPAMAGHKLEGWADHPRGAAPLGYVAMLRFDAPRLGLPRQLPGTGAVARTLLEAGAPVNGAPGDSETPLITAASYGDAEVAQALIDAGADLDVTAAADAGGVPGGSALLHAAVFGMTEVVDVLVAAGARVRSIEEAGAAGDIGGWSLEGTDREARIRALAMASDHQRLGVIDALIAAGTPVDATDARWGRQPLRIAAANGRAASVRRLLAHGADPNKRDGDGRTPLELCRRRHAELGESPAHDEVEAILGPLTSTW